MIINAAQSRLLIIRPRTLASQQGFTLVEVLIALFIFSLIASGTIVALRLGINGRDQMTASDARLHDMQVMRVLIKEDFAQVSPRSVRDEFGNLLATGFQGGESANIRNFNSDERILMRLVRNGWTNPNYDDPRSSLQYVEYVVRGETLIRRVRPFVDDAERQPEAERLILSDARDVEIEFLSGFANGEAQWIDRWPVDNGSSVTPGVITVPPVGVRIALNHPRFNALQQSFWLGRFSSNVRATGSIAGGGSGPGGGQPSGASDPDGDIDDPEDTEL